MTMTHPPLRQPSVLWVDDTPDVSRGAAMRLEVKTYPGVYRFVETYEDAKAALLGTRYTCIVLDLKLPISGASRENLVAEAGGNLITQLKQGAFGELNRSVAFVVHTGMTGYVDRRLAKLPGYRGAFQKVDDVDPMLQQVIDVVTDDAAPAARLWRTPARAVSARDRELRVVVDSWDSETEIPVPVSALPKEVLEAALTTGFPVHMILSANLAATDAADLNMSNFTFAQVPSDSELGLS